MTTVQELFDRALELNFEQRSELATRIMQTTIPDPPGEDISQGEWEQVWGDEITARIERLERGETQALSWDEVYNDLRAKFGKV